VARQGARNFAWVAAQGIKQGLSANAALRALRAAGGAIARGTWLRLYAQTRAEMDAESAEVSRPLDRRPRASEITYYETKQATGYLQHVDIYVRDRATGEVLAQPYSVKSDSLMTRADVIETALEAYGQHAERYGQTVLGATYTSTYLFAPSEG